ncbi:MAG: hypothetical protein K1X28_07195 [Parachlamydiales bacterium]|nr:hypothetical protein [Parachlamydiales bacterium]
MKRLLILLLAIAAGCHHTATVDTLSLIQIQDRNGLTETISNPDRLVSFQTVDFLTSQPYKKVLRVYKNEGKNRSRLTTYHPNGLVHQYLEAEEMRANGSYREWFPNGQLKIEAKVIGGTADLATGSQEDWVFDSISHVWDEQGHLIASIPYEKGVLQGKSIYYYPNEQVQREAPFAKGKLEGNLIEYWPNGKMKSKTAYKRGLKEGESLGFFEEGGACWVEDHSDDRLRQGSYFNKRGEQIAQIVDGSGYAARFEEDGMSLIEYRVGLPEGSVRKFNQQGELIRTFFAKNGLKQGEELEYYRPSEVEGASPCPKLSIQWNESRIHGCVKTWYNNGQLQSQREYSRNQRVGPSLAWYRDGSLMLYEEYEDGRLISGQYYKLQKKEPVSSVSNGNGLATLFDEKGAFIRKINYQKGKPVDPEE